MNMERLKNHNLELAKYTSDYYEKKDAFETAEMQLSNVKSKIIELLKQNAKKDNENDFYEFTEPADAGLTKHRFKLVKTSRINYDVEKLKERLSKEQKSRLLDKTVVISDFDGFKAYMKNRKIPFSDVSDFFSITEKVKTKELENMYAVGDIDLDKISDCYDVSTSFSLKVTDKVLNNE